MTQLNIHADDPHEIYDDGPLYASAAKIFPQRVRGTFRRLKWRLLLVCLGLLLFPAVRALGPRTYRAASGGAGRPRAFPLLFLLHRAVAAGGLLFHRPADPRLARAVSVQRAVRARLVRLFLPADGVDGSVLYGRTLDRGRPARPHQTRRGAVDAGQDPQARVQARAVAADRAGGRAAPGCSISPTRRRWCGQLATFQAPLAAYVWIGILTFTTYYLAGHMREQVCLYMCPWPRIQAALTDTEALNVTYRCDRGEPRMSVKEAQRARVAQRARGRLHRLQTMRQRLPDRRRHPQGLAARLHPVRPVHRRLRRGHDQDQSPDPTDRL